MKAFTKTVAIACYLISEAVALRVSNPCDNLELHKVTEADEVKGLRELLAEDAKNQNYISLENLIRFAEENALGFDAKNLFRLAARGPDTLDQRESKSALLRHFSRTNRMLQNVVSLDIPEWMHFERQADDFSCYRHTLNNLLNLLVPEESRDWEGLAFPTHEDLVACVGVDGRNVGGWSAWHIAQALFEKSKPKFGLVYVAESGIPVSAPTDGRCYTRGNNNHATFIYHQSETDGQCLPGWKKVCSGLGMTHFNNWEECRKELLDDVSQTMQVVSRGHSCFQDRFGRPVPICSVPLPIDDFQVVELYVEASTADQLFICGEMYNFGLGVSKDYKKAFGLYKRAAVRGHAHAHEQLGFMFLLGDGADFPSNLGMAEAWFRRAAELGCKNAAHKLLEFAEMYKSGTEEVSQDYEQALELYKLAAAHGSPSVQGAANGRLGEIYQQGLGVKKNMDQAFEFYKKSAEQLDNKNRQELVKKMKSKHDFWKRFGLGFK